MTTLRSIQFGVLKEFAQAKMIRELVAQRLPNRSGYYLIARLRSEDRMLSTDRSPRPRLFKTLDAVANEVTKLNIPDFHVSSVDPQSRRLR